MQDQHNRSRWHAKPPVPVGSTRNAPVELHVGVVVRHRELEAFQEAQQAGAVLFLHGPGGVGKTTLLDAYALEAASGGARVVRLSGRQVEREAVFIF